MAENLDSVIERIKKLLSYQNDKSTDSVAEFENAMAKVQDLLHDCHTRRQGGGNVDAHQGSNQHFSGR